jgi:hypothetical protein
MNKNAFTINNTAGVVVMLLLIGGIGRKKLALTNSLLLPMEL